LRRAHASRLLEHARLHPQNFHIKAFVLAGQSQQSLEARPWHPLNIQAVRFTDTDSMSKSETMLGLVEPLQKMVSRHFQAA